MRNIRLRLTLLLISHMYFFLFSQKVMADVPPPPGTGDPIVSGFDYHYLFGSPETLTIFIFCFVSILIGVIALFVLLAILAKRDKNQNVSSNSN